MYSLVPILNFCEGCESFFCDDRTCKKSIDICNICEVGIDNCGNQQENCTEKYKGMPQVYIKNEDVEITKHAYERAKNRLGLNKKALENLTNKALLNGIYGEQLKDLGIIKEIDTVKIVYGEHVFVFNRSTCLVTIYRVPNKYKNILLKQQKK